MILILGLAIVAGLLGNTLPKFGSIAQISREIKLQNDTLAETERKIIELKSKEEQIQKEKMEQVALKSFYKPIEEGVDAEVIMSDEIGEVLGIIKKNKIKTRSIKYEYDPQDDNFIKNSNSRFSACKLDLDMVSDYKTFETFLRDLYKHEHLIDISSVEIAPYSKNKKILLINSKLKLYAQKDTSEIMPQMRPQAPKPVNSGANPTGPMGQGKLMSIPQMKNPSPDNGLDVPNM